MGPRAEKALIDDDIEIRMNMSPDSRNQLRSSQRLSFQQAMQRRENESDAHFERRRKEHDDRVAADKKRLREQESRLHREHEERLQFTIKKINLESNF